MLTNEQKERVEKIIEDIKARGQREGRPPLPEEYLEDIRRSWYEHIEANPDVVIVETGRGLKTPVAGR
jgi:hypothetical protein